MSNQNEIKMVPVVGVAIVLMMSSIGVCCFASYKIGEQNLSEQLIKEQVKIARLQDSLNIYKSDSETLKTKLKLLENERINNSAAFNAFNKRFGKGSK